MTDYSPHGLRRDGVTYQTGDIPDALLAVLHHVTSLEPEARAPALAVLVDALGLYDAIPEPSRSAVRRQAEKTLPTLKAQP